jgi:hypothetical protein
VQEKNVSRPHVSLVGGINGGGSLERKEERKG